jgi:integrase
LVTDTPKLSAVILKHLELSEKRHLAAATMRKKTDYGEVIRKALGDKPIGEVSVRDIAGLIAEYVDAGKDTTARGIRSEAMEIWRTAMQEGHATVNVPSLTRAPSKEVKRARLTLDMWRAVREAANGLEPWVGLSMDLAMVTAQRVEDISLIEFRPREGATAWVEGGALWVIQGKTGNKVCIPLSLRLDVLGLELGEVVARCRDNVLSPYLLHYRRNSNAVHRGDGVSAQALSKGFLKARRLSGITWPEGKTAPTFHEQRSLAIREYTIQCGSEMAQALAGHRDAATTAIYQDERGAGWVRVSA